MSRVSLKSNIAAMQAQRYFARNSANARATHERLSSGLRINRAKDDAAGLAISKSLQVDERVYAQGVRNLNDGLSFLEIADSAVISLQSVVTRLQELSAQAANGALSQAQRGSLDREAQALKTEYNRIASTTSFNGRSVFDLEKLNLQAGFGQRESLEVNIGSHIAREVGTGEFVFGEQYSTKHIPSFVAFEDLNGDGIADLIVTNDSGANGEINIRLGAADGTFGEEIDVVTGTNRPRSLAFADFNNDGILDVLTGNNSGGANMTVGFGTGTGSFDGFFTFSTFPIKAESFVTGDFNGDGNQDFAVSGGGLVDVYSGDGAGGFTLAHTLDIGNSNPSTDSTESIEAVDLNNDGLLDLIVARDTYQRLGVHTFINQGDGTFSDANFFQMGDNEAFTIRTGDLDGDGILDAVVGNLSEEVILLKGQGDGTFTKLGNFTLGGSDKIRLVDLNGDGHLDLVGINDSTNSVHFAHGDGRGNFEKTGSFSESLATPKAMAMQDTNGNGVLDLVIANAGDRTISILLAETAPDVLLPEISLLTRESALEALPTLRAQSNLLSAERGAIGAAGARVETALNNLMQRKAGINEAQSRITDADIANESAALVKTSILQQSSIAVMSQANLQPQRLLSLLEI